MRRSSSLVTVGMVIPLFLLSIPSLWGQDFAELQLPKLSPAELSRDVELLWQGIDKYHSGAYWYTSRDSILQAFDEVRAQLTDSLDVLTFHRLIAPLLALTREDHADMYLPENVETEVLENAQLLPLSIVFLNRKMFGVLDGSDNEVDLRGKEIRYINGKTPQELALEMGQLFASDGYIERVKFSDLSDYSFSYYHYLMYGQVDTFQIVFKNGEETDTVRIDAVPLSVFLQQIQVRYPEEVLAEEELPAVEFRLLNDSTAYLGIHTFSTYAIRKDKQSPRYKKFLKNAFKTITESGIQRLIVDVSENGGGNEGNENLLYSYLGDNYQKYQKVRAKTQLAVLDNGVDPPQRAKTFSFWERTFFNNRMPDGSYERKPNISFGLMAYKREPKYKFQGELFVLISPVTYSGGSEFANMVYTQQIATFLGEETGGGYYGNTSGYSYTLELHNSGITADLPALQFVMNVKDGTFGRGVIPRRQVIPDITTYLEGREAVLRFVLRGVE